MKQRQMQKFPRRKMTHRNIVYVELDTKCSCTQITSNNGATIQFTRRYLQCSSLMPIRILRLLIQTILPHSPLLKVSIFDSNDRLLKDSVRLYSLKHSYSSSSNHIPLRFILLNTVTSFSHCSCLSPPIKDHLSSLPTTIESETIDQILSTCSITQSTLLLSPRSMSPRTPMSICSTPLPHSGFLIDCEPDQSTVDLITSEFGEICSPIPDSISQENLPTYPLDLSLKSKFSDNFCDTNSFPIE